MERAVARGLSIRDSKDTYKHAHMDKKNIRIGREYVSILYDTKDGTVLEVYEGCKNTIVTELRTKTLTAEQRNKAETACTDM